MKKMLLLLGLFVMALVQTVSAQIKVRSPNGGETFIAPGVITVEWDVANNNNGVLVEVTYDGGINWQAQGIYYNNSMSLYTDKASVKAKIRVTNLINSNDRDESDTYFVIQPFTLQLLTPTTGEKLIPNSLYTIQWQDNAPNMYKLSYSTNSGSTWKVIHAGPYTGTSYQWVVPADYSTNCRIKIESYYVSKISAISQPFSIVPTSFQVTSPAGTSIWKDKSTVTIKWVDDIAANSYHIDFRSTSSAPWKRLKTNIPGNAAGINETTITTPNLPCEFESGTAQVMVSRVVNGTVLATRTSNYFETADGPDLDCGGMFSTEPITETKELAMDPVKVLSAATVNLYPNPVHKQLSVQLKGLSEVNMAMVTVYDASGKIVVQKRVSVTNGSLQTDIDVAALAVGTYLLKLSDGTQTYTATFIKQ
jgi:hypothetical protein